MNKTINYKNDPVTLVGRKIKTSMKAPDFVLIADDLSKVRLDDYNGKISTIKKGKRKCWKPSLKNLH